MAPRTILIPKRFGDAQDILRRETKRRGIGYAETNLRVKSVSADLTVLINWVVHYVNTAGRRDYANYVSKSGKSIVFRSSGSIKLAEFSPPDYSSTVLSEGTEISLRSEVRKPEARELLVNSLSESLRVPKRAIEILSAEEVFLARKVVYSFEIGECSGQIELGEGSPKFSLEPLPIEKLERKALESIKIPETRSTLELGVKRDKVMISRSWDSIFSEKRPKIDERKREIGAPEVLSREVEENHVNFVIRFCDDFKFVQVNKYTGAVTANFSVAEPEKLKKQILESFASLTSLDPSKAELISNGISDFYRVERSGKSPSITSQVRIRAFPYIYYVDYHHSSGKLSVLRKEIDEERLRTFLVDALGTSDFSHEYEGEILYVKAKLRNSWSFMLFNMSKLGKTPDLTIRVEKIFHDPKSDHYIMFWRPEGSSECMAFVTKYDLKGVSVLKSPCIEEIMEKVRKAILSKYGVGVRVSVKHEQGSDEIVKRISPKIPFRTSQGRVNASLHFSGVDSKLLFSFNARYSIESGDVTIEEPRIMNDAPERIVKSSLGLKNPEILSYKYDHPFLNVKVRNENEVITLKYDLSDITNPVIVEKKIHRGIFSVLKDVLFK